MANIESVRLPDGSEYSIASGSQPNLLINPWFTVNQRGFTSGTSADYTVDRWKKATSAGTLTLTSNGLQFPASTECEVQQIFESMPWDGREITISLMYSDGTIVSGTDTWTTGGAKTFISDSKMIVGLNSSGNLSVKHSTSDANTRTIRAVKLEIGSTSTLHLDTAPDYTTELLKCQRYFVRLIESIANGLWGFALATSSTTAIASYFFNVPMRTTPTISTGGAFRLIVIPGFDSKSISALAPELAGMGILAIYLTTSGLTAGNFYMWGNTTAGSYIDLSAEL